MGQLHGLRPRGRSALRPKGEKHPNTLFAVATAGGKSSRGAPNVGDQDPPGRRVSVLDVGIAHDTPGRKATRSSAATAGRDHTTRRASRNRFLRDLVIETAGSSRCRSSSRASSVAHRRRPHPHDRRGRAEHFAGHRVGYIHCPQQIIDRRDFDATVKLLVAVVKAPRSQDGRELR